VNPAINKMLQRYAPRTVDDSVQALREIIQEVALLGLWRAKFFEHAAFYGGTALRILYGLDRFSEDLDFSLLGPTEGFNLGKYTESLEEELRSFGFKIRVEMVDKAVETAVQSAFLKGNTRNELLVIETGEELARQIPAGHLLRVKLEIDTEPPPGFDTETKYLLNPVPFAVRCYTLPNLFAGKMHALLFRKWKNRVKGRDWYDFIWYAANHPELHLAHLEQRMRQTGHWNEEGTLTEAWFRKLLADAIDRLNLEQAKKDVFPFLKDPRELEVWSADFFKAVAAQLKCV
jgi:predicted nucleotidyltransferase component of viral defense system